jgi:hypothetical protein
MRPNGKALALLDLLIVELLVVGLTIFLTDASSSGRYVVWSVLVVLPVATFALLGARRSPTS